MTHLSPERAELILRNVISSLGGFISELELIDGMRNRPTPAVQHLLGCMRQSKKTLEQLLEPPD